MILTTQQAAERLRISDQRVRALIKAGRLPATKFGKSHLIQERDLVTVEKRRAERLHK